MRWDRPDACLHWYGTATEDRTLDSDLMRTWVEEVKRLCLAVSRNCTLAPKRLHKNARARVRAASRAPTELSAPTALAFGAGFLPSRSRWTLAASAARPPASPPARKRVENRRACTYTDAHRTVQYVEYHVGVASPHLCSPVSPLR